MPITKTEQETREIAQQIAQQIQDGGLIYLYGELGTGKTTFTKGLARAFGIEEFSIKSPTYTYIRKYKTNNNSFYHIDLYRLEELDELMIQEIEELIQNPRNIIIIEWADRLPATLQKPKIEITLKYINPNSREITICSHH